MPIPYPKQDITGLVLAGGLGRRMGGQDKGTIVFDGEPLAVRLMNRLTPQSSRVLLSANRSHDTYRGWGMEPIPDAKPGFAGPLAGIEAALVHCTTPLLLICPCDTPHIPENMGERLWQALSNGDHQASHARTSERDHYLHLLLRTELAKDLSDYLDNGGRAVRHWLARLSVATASFPSDSLANLNTPTD